RIRHERAHVELTVVKRERERVVAERGGTVDEVCRGVRNPIDRVVGGVRVEINLEHGLFRWGSAPHLCLYTKLAELETPGNDRAGRLRQNPASTVRHPVAPFVERPAQREVNKNRGRRNRYRRFQGRACRGPARRAPRW